MAVDMFLKLGSLKGEAMDSKHKGEIDVLSWSWGESQSGTQHHGGGGGSGKVHVHDLSFTKWVDLSTPDMWQACASGKHYDKATLVVRKAGENPLKYLKIELTYVLVTSITMGGSGGQDRLTENVAMNFGKYMIYYKEQDATGKAGASPQAGWDVAGNVKM